jgi:hypothetical protein
MNTKWILYAAGVAIVVAASAFAVNSCRSGQGSVAEQRAAVESGVADTLVNNAQSIHTHKADLDKANAKTRATEASLAKAKAELARVKRILADVPPAPPDKRDEVIAAQEVLIEAQDTKIVALEGENTQLKIALVDETKRSENYRLAEEARGRQAQAQEAATKAWKQAVSSAEWKGAAKGAPAGAIAWEIARRLLKIP